MSRIRRLTLAKLRSCPLRLKNDMVFPFWVIRPFDPIRVSEGWKENSPFDRILISCACPFVPKTLFDQLKEGGKIIAPVGDMGSQVLEILEKNNGKPFKRSYEGGLFVFVPMKGKSGFS